MQTALYGPEGFFIRQRPRDHFRTSVHASPLFAGAIATLLMRIDEALEHPGRLDLVDVGAGRGELLSAVLAALPGPAAGRVRATAVEKAPRPGDLPPTIEWTAQLPSGITGLLIATEWLDNVPVDIVEKSETGLIRYLGSDDPLDPPDDAWLRRWWPLDDAPPGARAEIGRPRDEAWAAAVRSVERGLALAVDYGHFAADRPLFGTLSAYQRGHQVEPIPDGERDLTVAVALDSLGSETLPQREALRLLGVDGTRPPLALAGTDPVGYLKRLAQASAAAELTDPAGLGGHHWVMHWV
ncbi:SAM-dependent methyltransferase [Dactylosporangium vinaceum]|uniref:SAM-dependent methyltransferase n=1 Tax=Dactylosporangium vinaceum TaxID=53362 RepID=A0ABV5M147_9ACTN|nr:SAM-dependent methyltransferase [Dactylosporangium vinaceum]UAC01425.1 SAM-dependent methyltransferase [Dactylosporangium vinaceum]